jgi:hypothetical protein
MKPNPRRKTEAPTPQRKALRVSALIVGVLVFAAICAAAIAGLMRPVTPAMAQEVVVYKSPTCLCCDKWVQHMQKAGFRTRVEAVPNVAPVKAEHGVPALLGSCHTAVVDGYAIEGHVPADDVRRLLEERPAVAGLAVPGMPMGSPGMEGARHDRYEVIAFQKDGTGTVFSRR